MKRKKKRLSDVQILSMLPLDVQARFSKLGFDFLKAQGYDVTGAEESEKVRRRIAAQLDKKRSTLIHRVVLTESDKSVNLWFEMLVNGRIRAKSEAMKVYLIPTEVTPDGEDAENTEDTQ